MVNEAFLQMTSLYAILEVIYLTRYIIHTFTLFAYQSNPPHVILACKIKTLNHLFPKRKYNNFPTLANVAIINNFPLDTTESSMLVAEVLMLLDFVTNPPLIHKFTSSQTHYKVTNCHKCVMRQTNYPQIYVSINSKV